MALWFLPNRGIYAQDDPRCVGTRHLYAADTLSSSTFEYSLISGGNIISSDPKGKVIVQWGNTTGTYRLGVREKSPYEQCVSEWAYLDVPVVGQKAKFTQDTYVMCIGDSVQVSFNASDFLAHEWVDRSIKNNYIKKPGTYELRTFDKDGCRLSNYVTIKAQPRPTINLGRDTMICVPEFRLYASRYNLNPQGTTFSWSTGETGTSPYVDITNHDITRGAIYWVTASLDGCSVSDTIIILACAEDNPIVKGIPNTFTPNGDGDNDVWEIKVLRDYPNAVVEVYDRWGRKVFNSARGYPQPWDGRDSRGRVLPMETYYYIINLNDGSKPILGTITIIL